MEAVEEVEFAGDLVSNTSRDTLTVVCFVDLDSGVEGPSRFSMIEICNAANIAVQISITVEVGALYMETYS